MADITRTFTLEEAATVLLVGYGFVSDFSNLTFVINGTEATEPLSFSPGAAEGSQLMLYGITTLAAGEHTVILRGVSNNITEGWLWVTVGENTGNNTIGVND